MQLVIENENKFNLGWEYVYHPNYGAVRIRLRISLKDQSDQKLITDIASILSNDSMLYHITNHRTLKLKDEYIERGYITGKNAENHICETTGRDLMLLVMIGEGNISHALLKYIGFLEKFWVLLNVIILKKFQYIYSLIRIY